MTEDAKLWLEISKLLASIITPLVVVIVGVYVSRHLKRFESAIAFAGVMTSRRLDFYISVSKDLNSLYCYFMHVGLWRSLSPPEVLQLKSILDAEFARAMPYMPGRIYESYLSLIDVCFTTGRGRDTRALLNANREMHSQNFEGDWRSDWNAMFSPEEQRARRSSVHEHYMGLLTDFSFEYGSRLDRQLVDLLSARLLMRDRHGIGRDGEERQP